MSWPGPAGDSLPLVVAVILNMQLFVENLSVLCGKLSPRGCETLLCTL